MTKEQLQNTIETASRVVGKTWPLYSFVTSNPLSGYEKAHFKKAAGDAEHLLGGKSFQIGRASCRERVYHDV